MRIDHIAYRVADRVKSAQFFIDALGYKIQTTFELEFDDGSTTSCIALAPPEKLDTHPWTHLIGGVMEMHCPPEVFVSDGPSDSIVGKWVAARDGVGGIHHIAYQVDSVSETMKEWREKGYAEFTTDEPLTCPDLVQCFTKPSSLTGTIYEFIERGAHGFCVENVKDLMNSTKGL